MSERHFGSWEVAMTVLRELTWHEIACHPDTGELRALLRSWGLNASLFESDSRDPSCSSCAEQKRENDSFKDWLDDANPGVVHVRMRPKRPGLWVVSDEE